MDKLAMQQIWFHTNPLRTDRQLAEVPVGQTLRQIAGPAPIEAWVDGVRVDAHFIENEIVPKDAYIVLTPVPQGADVWKTVGVIGLIIVGIVAPFAIPALVGAMGVGGFWATVLTGVISAG
ncbi:MAG: hypothetical protein WC992_07025, partial [Acholeplasmataceae bacterium]